MQLQDSSIASKTAQYFRLVRPCNIL